MNVNQDIVDRQFKAKTFDGLLDDLVTEIEALNYRVTRINHIDNIHDRREAGINVTIGFKRYKIVEFCNLNSCSELISADLRAGVFMPVRFIVYQRMIDSQWDLWLLDSATGTAAYSLAPDDHHVVTIQLNVNFVRAAEKGDVLTAHGRVRHPGRKTMVVHGEVVNQTNDLVALASATFMVLPMPKK